MRVVLVGREQDELSNPGRLPSVEEIVEHSVERFFSDGCVTGESALGLCIHTVLDGRSEEHAKLGGEVAGQSLDDDGITAEWEMGSVLLAGSDRNDESRVALDVLGDRRRQHGL